LPDINVWLALAFDAHQHHPHAAAWFDGLPTRSCAFCRFTQQGFLRLATNPAVLKDDAVTLAEAWTCYDELIKDDRVFFLAEQRSLLTAGMAPSEPALERLPATAGSRRR